MSAVYCSDKDQTSHSEVLLEEICKTHWAHMVDFSKKSSVTRERKSAVCVAGGMHRKKRTEKRNDIKSQWIGHPEVLKGGQKTGSVENNVSVGKQGIDTACQSIYWEKEQQGAEREVMRHRTKY